MLRSATAKTLPPRPPSPPSGPPRGMYFSRRKDTAPLPPSPAWTSIMASSMNFMDSGLAGLAFRFALVEPEAFVAIAGSMAFPDERPSRFRKVVVVPAALHEEHAAVVLRL